MRIPELLQRIVESYERRVLLERSTHPVRYWATTLISLGYGILLLVIGGRVIGPILGRLVGTLLVVNGVWMLILLRRP